MKLYQPYEEKILKLAEVKAKIMRYKYLILACLLLIVAGISTLLYFKGNIRKDVQLQTQYTYGDTIAYDAKAFMSKPKLVFYQDGKEISMPTRPGAYTAQVVARGAFGIKKYGKMQAFVIVHKTATVRLSSDHYVYGETPSLVVNVLANNDTVDTENLRFLYHDVLGDAPTLQVVPESFRILNKQGENVTDCYDFKDSVYTPKSVRWTKRYITVKTDSLTQVYNGADVSCPQYQIALGTLAEGDSLQTQGFPSLHGVGEIQNSAEFTVENSQGVDVSKMYNITKTFGKIKVTPKPLTITTCDRQKLYDGTPFDEPSYQVEGLIDGHSVAVHGYSTATQAGVYDNYLNYDIKTAGGESVKGNYAITETWGKLTIFTKKLVVAVLDKKPTYNGAEITNFYPQFLQGNMLPGESLTITAIKAYDAFNQETVVKDAGTYTVEIVEYQLNRQSQDAPPYLIELQAGEYTVKQRPITVRLTNAEKYYNREPLTSSKFTTDDLVDGHSVKVTSVGSITEPGQAINELNGVEIYDENKQPVTRNYQITKKNGVLTVHKRKITICPLPIVKTYDGQAIAYPAELPDAMKAAAIWTNKNDSLQDGNALLSGDYIEFTSVSIANPALVNVGETDITLSNAYVKYADGTMDNSRYYDVTIGSSKAVIKPIEIEVYSLSHTKIYDGTPLVGTVADCYINKGALVNGDTIEYRINASQTQAGSCKNLITEVVIRNGTQVVGYVRCDASGNIIDGNLDTYNYHIKVVHGTLGVQARNNG